MTDRDKINRFVSEVGRVSHAPPGSINQKESTTMEFDNTNRGVLFSERDKKTKDDDRDYSGSINIGGAEYWLSAWIKTSKKGTKFLSLSVKPKEDRTGTASGSRQRDMNDSIPFGPEGGDELGRGS
jgi:hypothetical protein